MGDLHKKVDGADVEVLTFGCILAFKVVVDLEAHIFWMD